MPIIAGLVAALVLLALLPGAGPVARAAPGAADIAPALDVIPVTLSAPAGGTFMYKIRIHNDNTASEDLRRVDVTLSYDPGTLTLIDSKLRDTNDWVSKVQDGKATVQFGKIAQDDARSATLIFRVNPAVANGALIQAAATYHWWAADADGAGSCHIDNVIAVSANVAAPAFIAPTAGPPGTIFQIGATGFKSKEQVVTWLNTPSGVQGLSLTGKASSSGNIRLQFDSAALAPGSYGLVLHGLDSGREYLLPFLVTTR
jgi:hypothetical protein